MKRLLMFPVCLLGLIILTSCTPAKCSVAYVDGGFTGEARWEWTVIDADGDTVTGYAATEEQASLAAKRYAAATGQACV